MSAGQLFSLLNLVALAGWIMLALFPKRRVIVDVIAGGAIPALLAVVYVALIAAQWHTSDGGFGTLADVATLFANPWLLLAGWVHYLAFDLLTGCWEVRDAGARGVPHLLVVPCLALTFLFGPAGWLLYQGVRRRFTATRVHEAASIRPVG
jgi:hypothetical protein